MLEYYPSFVEAAIEYKMYSRRMIAESKSKLKVFLIILYKNRLAI
jgi:hypothetical protein